MSLLEYDVGRQPGPPTRKRIEVDPITLRVLGGAFHAIAKEMAGVLFRMSYSSIIRESEDLGAGIFDDDGRELCESDSTPMHIGSLPWYIRGFLWRLEREIEDGDVIVHNHPYLGASHSPDVAVAVPIFHEGELLGFAAVTAHVLDVGGSFPGINADAFDVYAEAKMYNALRWYRRGELNEDLDRMLFDNVRTETMNRGDMNAMLAACQLGRDRFLRLVDRYGADVVMSAAQDCGDDSERMLRQEIAKIPDGTYGPVVGWLDDDARNRGERLRDETTFPEHVPQNDGVFRPVKVIAPKGTIFNPTFPRACFSRFCQTQRVVDNVNLALADALPDKVTGGNSAGIHFCAYAGEGDRQTDAPRGVFGGWDGLVASCRKNPDTPRQEELPAKVTGIPFAAGEFIEFREPNAAGYGDPLERDPEQVREDVLDDFTTVELAREAYGVVFTDEKTVEIDAEATEARRAELRAARDGG